MTQRERVLAAMAHREPDRTPCFERIIKSPHSDALLGRPCAATNFDFQMSLLADGAHDELCRKEARDRVDLATSLGYDMIALGPNAGPPALRPKRISPGAWRIGDAIAEQADSGWIRWRSDGPPAAPRTDEEQAHDLEAFLDSAGAPVAPTDHAFVVFDEAQRIMKAESLDLAVYASCYGMPVCTLPALYLEWFHTRPELLKRYYRWLSDGTIARASACVERGAHIIGLGGDLACDAGPVISPAHHREFIVPEIRRQAAAVHALSAFATNTSDGNLWPILNDFLIGTDVDGFGEIDFVAGMDLARLKRLLKNPAMGCRPRMPD